MLVTLKCPECGHEAQYQTDLKPHGKTELYFCDYEDGGCDKSFAAKITTRIEVDIKIYRMRLMIDE